MSEQISKIFIGLQKYLAPKKVNFIQPGILFIYKLSVMQEAENYEP